MTVRSAARWLATTPGEVFWLTGVAIRAMILPGRIRRRSLPDLLAALTPQGPARHRLPDPERMVRLTDRLLRRRIGPLQPNCLERSLLLYRELRRAGEPVDFCLGVRRRAPGTDDGHPVQRDLHGHAWLAVGGEPVYERSPKVAGVYRETYPPPRPDSSRDAAMTEGPRRTVAESARPGKTDAAGLRGRRSGSREREEPRVLRARLLAACARTRVDSEAALNLRSLAADSVDWSAFVAEAQRHGVLPLVARSLASFACEQVPAPVREQLRAWMRAQAARNAMMFATLADATGRLEAAGLRGIPVKGPTLALRAYDSVTLRQFSDLDILVRKADVPQLISVLEDAGYPHLKTDKTVQYVKFSAPNGGFHLDVQWGIAPKWYRFPLDLAALEKRSERRRMGGHDLWQPSDEDLLLLLCGHATKHCWSKLGWIVDLNEFLSRCGHALDWDLVFTEARRTGGQRQLLLGLVLARDVFGAPLPTPMREPVFRDRRLGTLTTEIRRKLVAPADTLTASCGAFTLRERWSFQIRARERWRDRVAYARHLMAKRSARRQMARGVLRAGRQAVSRKPA